MLTVGLSIRISLLLFLASMVVQAGTNTGSVYHSDFEERTIEAYMNKGTVHPFILMLSADSRADIEGFQNGLEQIESYSSWFKENLEKTNNEVKSLKKLFTRVHTRSFQTYELHTSMSDLINNKVYNCVTGSGYFAYLLKNLGYEPQIWETPYHVYLSFKDSQGQRIMIETTDRAFGFITSETKMKELEAHYSSFEGSWGIQYAGAVNADTKSQQSEKSYLKSISFIQLHALQYLNQGVTSFENGELDQAYLHFQKAHLFYPSPRTESILELFDH